MTPPHSDFPSHKIKRSALSLGAKLTILLQKTSDGTYVPNWAPPHPFRIPKSSNTTYQLYQSWIKKEC